MMGKGVIVATILYRLRRKSLLNSYIIMKTFIVFFFLIGWCWVSGSFAAERSEFEYFLPLEGAGEVDAPVRVALAPEVITLTSNQFADLRVFDDQGQETPFIIYTQQPVPAIAFDWQVLSYQSSAGMQTVVLERPAHIRGTVKELGVDTPNRDFEKELEIFASADQQSWKSLTRAVIFDFSSRINLRKTHLEFPATTAKYLKIQVHENIASQEQGENLRFRYKDLEFAVSEQPRTDELTLTRFHSQALPENARPVEFSHTIFAQPTISLDQDKNSIISLGRVNLPLERVNLRIGKGFFYRTVELFVAQQDQDDAHFSVAQDVIYRVPGIDEEKTSLEFRQTQYPYLRLKIVNHDNPPLTVQEVTVLWAQRDLYFIPEPGRSYALYCSGNAVQTPKYDIQQLIPPKYDRLLHYAEWQTGTLQKNPNYRAQADRDTRAKLERYLFIGFVILIAAALGWWMLQLMKKVERHDKE
ncbi:hypothetical protein U27_02499 [Candidatus Vecturithrix granuli]|uniref:Uncharacterized protein n=1 Tax=Vecturithrix granuli TaxID=1499967 RepID=A0A0S6WBE2_VECG1|nr:hypothetical protein U27_02499 [Candidatus Vecturithrix granuli]